MNQNIMVMKGAILSIRFIENNITWSSFLHNDLYFIARKMFSPTMRLPKQIKYCQKLVPNFQNYCHISALFAGLLS